MLELTADGVQALQASRATFGKALADCLGTAAPATELTRLSRTLRGMRRHLDIARRAAG